MKRNLMALSGIISIAAGALCLSQPYASAQQKVTAINVPQQHIYHGSSGSQWATQSQSPYNQFPIYNGYAWPAYIGPLLPTIGYSVPGYASAAENYVYPSLYSSYAGLPTFVYSPDYGVNVYSAPPVLFDNGTFYSLDNDPYGAGIVFDPSAAIAATSDTPVPQAQAIPSGLQQSLGDISNSWVSNDVSGIERHVASDSAVNIIVNGVSSYAVNPAGFSAMTRDAVANLKTTAFRFTGVRLQPSGDAVAYGVQDYSGRTGMQSRMYVAYLLHREAAAIGAYSIRAMETSTRPLTGQASMSQSGRRG